MVLYASFYCGLIMQSEYVLSACSVVEVSIENEYYPPTEEVFLGDSTLEYVETTDEITSSDLKKFW